MKNCTPFLKQCFVTVAVCSSCISQGCLIAFSGVLLPQLQQPSSSVSVSNDQASWIAAVSSIAMLFGSFLILPVMEQAGRKKAQYTIVITMLLGWLIMALATNFVGLVAAKIIQGLAYGMIMPLRSIIIGEYTSPRYRGGFLSLINLTKTFGIFFVHFVGSVTTYKITALTSMMFPFTSLIMTLFSPESPSWLATQGKYDECRKAFVWLRGEEEMAELEELTLACEHLSNKQIKKSNTIKHLSILAQRKEIYKPVILIIAMFIMLNFAGGTLMGTYAVTVLKLLMGPDINANVWMVALDAVRLLFSVISIYVTNRFKRRIMTFLTSSVSIGSMLAIAAYVFLKTKGFCSLDALWIPGIFIILQIIALAMGVAPLPTVIAGEVLPLQYRGFAGGVTQIAAAGSMFVLLKTFLSLTSTVGFSGAYLLYSVIMIFCLIITWVLLPETSGRTLLQIEEHFRGGPLIEPRPDSKETKPLNKSNENDFMLL